MSKISPANTTPDNLLSIASAAKKLKVSLETLRRWEKDGKLVSVRTSGGHRRYNLTDINNLLNPTQLPPIKEVVQPTLSVQEAASLLKVTPMTLRRWESEGKLTPIRTQGGHRRYPVNQLNQNRLRKYDYTPVAPVFFTSPAVSEVPSFDLKYLYSSQPSAQKHVIKYAFSLLVIMTGLVSLSHSGISFLSDTSKQLLSQGSRQGSVLQATSTLITPQSLNINIDSSFKNDVEILGNLTVGGETVVGNLTATGSSTLQDTSVNDLTVNGTLTLTDLSIPGDLTVGGLTTLDSTVLTDTSVLNIGGSGSTVAYSVIGDTTTGASSNVASDDDLYVEGNLEVDGLIYGTLANASTDASTLDGIDSGSFLRSDTSDSFTSGVLTLASGTTLLLDGALLNIGGNGSTVDYNVIGDSTSGASASVNSDDDLYIEGNLEVDGTIVGTLDGSFNPGLTQGSVLFQGATAMSGDSTNFFWDDSNNRLGLGTNSPSTTLHVVGTSTFSSTTNFNGDVVLGDATSDLITFTSRITNGTSLIPAVDLGSDLGTASFRFNNIYAANLTLDSGFTSSGQLLTTYNPADTTFAEASIRVNPTSPSANEQMLGIGQGGEERAAIDAEGDLSLGYDGTAGTSVPTTANPLMVYNHGTTNIFSVDTSGTVLAAGVYSGTSGTNLRLQATGSTQGSTSNSSIYFLNSSGTTAGRFDTVPDNNTIDTTLGTGADGDLNVASGNTFNLNTNTFTTNGRSYADGIAYRVNAPSDSATSVTVYHTQSLLSNGIERGDEVLIINMQGTTGDTTDVGNYEFMRVSSVTSDTITFTSAITKSYNGSTPSNQKVVIQRVPNYNDVTVSGTITASAWNTLTTPTDSNTGYQTGIVAFRANGTVSISGSVSSAGKGYLGGSGASNASGTPDSGGTNGESYDGTVGNGGGAVTVATGSGGKGVHESTAVSAGVARSGGGGGGSGRGGSGGAGGGGGGGGHAGGGGGGASIGSRGSATGGNGGAGSTAGSAGGGGAGSEATANVAGCNGGAAGSAAASGCTGTAGGAGSGATSGDGGGGTNAVTQGGGSGGGGGGIIGQAAQTQMFLGGGGGGGGAGVISTSGTSASGDNGMAGGGIVFFTGSTVTVTGSVTADGTAADGASAVWKGDGGAGAGGSVVILAGSPTLGSGLVHASGGAASNGGVPYSGAGGGGEGRVRVEYTGSLSGTTTPTASTQASINSEKQAPSALSTLYGTLYAGAVNTTSADLAEQYPSVESLSNGEIVEWDESNQGHIKKAKEVNRLAGIVSSSPGLLLGEDDQASVSGVTKYPLALSGRVPVRMATSSSSIKVGDFITLSTNEGEEGQGKKLEGTGYYIARSLENFDQSNPKSTIEAFVTLGFSVGSLTESGSLDIPTTITTVDTKIKLSLAERLKLFGSSILGDSTTASESAEATESASLDLVTDTSIKDSLLSLSDRIKDLEDEVASVSGSNLTTYYQLLESNQASTSANPFLALSHIYLDGYSSNINSDLPLSFQNLNLANTQFQNQKIELTTQGDVIIREGKLIGNDQIRGTLTLNPGETVIQVNKNWQSSPETIVITPSYLTQFAVTTLSDEGFTVTLGTPSTEPQQIRWLAVW